ncbi:MAG: serine hydrolase domain-containing protein [Lysobacterales bacterium]
MKITLVTALAVGTMVASAAEAPAIEGLWVGTLKADSGQPVPLSMTLPSSTTSEVKLGLEKSASVTVDLGSGALWTGEASGHSDSIEGFYIQPGNAIGGQRMAHAVSLGSSDSKAWQGTATPLAREFSVLMNIAPSTEKTWTATLMNPQRNITGPARRYDLEIHESGESFLLNAGGNTFTAATIDSEAERLRMGFGPIEELVLERVPADSPFRTDFLGQPDRTGLTAPSAQGAWPVGNVNDAGFDQDALSKLIESIAIPGAMDQGPDMIHSLLVARGGKLVVEEYFRGNNKNTPHDIRSAGKTFASVLVGALIQQGIDISGDSLLSQFVQVPYENSQQPITVGHLLTHQSGLDCNDADSNSEGNEDTLWQLIDDPNFWHYTAGLTVVATPGTRYAYCSGGINLVGAALKGASGKSVLSLLQKLLFEPLGFRHAYWNVMPNNEAYLGGGAHLRSRDLLKIGQLYLDGGKWLGRQLIDPTWVKESVAPIVEITPETTGLSEQAFNNFYFGGTDGYAWHLHSILVGEKTYKTYEASGNGGQMVVVVPDLDLVVAMTGGNYMQGYIWGRWRQKIVGDGVAAALLSR